MLFFKNDFPIPIFFIFYILLRNYLRTLYVRKFTINIHNLSKPIGISHILDICSWYSDVEIYLVNWICLTFIHHYTTSDGKAAFQASLRATQIIIIDDRHRIYVDHLPIVICQLHSKSNPSHCAFTLQLLFDYNISSFLVTGKE